MLYTNKNKKYGQVLVIILGNRKTLNESITMKRILIIITLVILPFYVFGQYIKHKSPVPHINYNDNINLPLTPKERIFIEEVYGEYTNQYIYDNPNRLKEIKNILRNRVFIEEYANKDLSSLKKLSEISLLNSFNNKLNRDYNIDVENFNPLKYNFNFYSIDNIKYYRIDNTQYLITIMPQHTK